MRNAALAIRNDSVLKETKIVARPLPLCSEINLFLLEEDYPKEPVSRFEFNANIASPPYWAFCWASGQALARFILDNRALVQDKKVLDFGAGSGVAGIAAAKAGACTVVACDIDPEARKAIQANADLNQVTITTLEEIIFSDQDFDFDVVIAGDVCYDQKNISWLSSLALQCFILLADSRVKRFPEDLFTPVARFKVKTVPDIYESEEFNDIIIYNSHVKDYSGPALSR
ncbi:MAG: 50S ribosomal protein L11 methyltransferase [Thermodesulfobacteriota bacterium]|jgi:predicted nicotinamide N-methyase|nr:MAG: 50S ribosomal protein L11 methyltransferase [Thermodesulfobacteriota bacterium]